MACPTAVCLGFRDLLILIAAVAILTAIPAALLVEIFLAWVGSRLGYSIDHAIDIDADGDADADTELADPDGGPDQAGDADDPSADADSATD